MNKRPLSVTLLACLYIAAGAFGCASHLTQFRLRQPFQYDILWASLVSLIALICGIYLLRAGNWARWLAVAWIIFHVILSAFHSRFELAIHSLLCVVFAYVLFRPAAARYFHPAENKAVGLG
ncbi:MAG TPA: hypothetical protein VGL97_08915 [Bryobacteraceae bacterium]